MYIYICIYVCMYIYIYIRIYVYTIYMYTWKRNIYTYTNLYMNNLYIYTYIYMGMVQNRWIIVSWFHYITVPFPMIYPWCTVPTIYAIVGKIPPVPIQYHRWPFQGYKVPAIYKAKGKISGNCSQHMAFYGTVPPFFGHELATIYIYICIYIFTYTYLFQYLCN